MGHPWQGDRYVCSSGRGRVGVATRVPACSLRSPIGGSAACFAPESTEHIEKVLWKLSCVASAAQRGEIDPVRSGVHICDIRRVECKRVKAG